MITAILGAMGFAISFALNRLLFGLGTRLVVNNDPLQRSPRDNPVPTHGGLAILTTVVIGLFVVVIFSKDFAIFMYTMIAGAALTGAVSFWDDLRPLPLLPRFAVHILAAALLLLAGLNLDSLSIPGFPEVSLGLLGPPVTLLFTVWFINLYNFMDGLDGLAGGLGVIGFTFLAAVGWIGGHQSIVWCSVIIAGANLGFLVHNFPPARIFMGDAGSIPMGLLAAAISLWGVRAGAFELWVPLLIFSPFIVDATITLLRRVLYRERFWEPHCSHYYQRLVLLGWSHRKTVLAEYALMLGVGVSALVLHAAGDGRIVLTGLAGWGAVYFVLAMVIRHSESVKTGD